MMMAEKKATPEITVEIEKTPETAKKCDRLEIVWYCTGEHAEDRMLCVKCLANLSALLLEQLKLRKDG